jgi:hypothetical protein
VPCCFWCNKPSQSLVLTWHFVGICRMTPKIFASGQTCGQPQKVSMRRMSSVALNRADGFMANHL